MELMEGGNLARALAATPQSARHAANLVGALAQAMHVAHQSGFVHRDLKPANIQLTAGGTPRIGDFALARYIGEDPVLALSGARIGTPSYMAPEQFLGKAEAVGPATDIYALGAVLYEMLTGRPPFRGATDAEIERQVVFERPVRPSQLSPKIPRDLETICLTCLHKAHSRRYADGEALAEDLRRFLEGRSIQGGRTGWLARAWRWWRRHLPGTALAMTLA
jgi:serine/threonine-protein kinase